MTKWDDKHMYNWIGWMRSLLVMRENINDWTTSPKKAYKFPIFMANNLIISPLVLFAIFLMSIPQTIEWAMSNLINWVDHHISHTNALDGLKGFPVVMVTIFILIPYAITWGLPRLIQEIKQSRLEKRLQRQAEDMERLREQIAEDTRQWGAIVDGVIREQELTSSVNIFTKHKKDFKPKKKIKAHSLVKSPLVFRSPGVFTIETDHSYVTYGDYLRAQDRANLERVRERRVRLNRRTRREAEYYNNIGNE